MNFLLFFDCELAGKRVELKDGDHFILGREEGVVQSVEDPLVSKRHYSVQREGTRYVLRDLNSSNGTFLNGRRLESATALSPGDIITAGAVRCEFLKVSKPDTGERDSLLKCDGDFQRLNLSLQNPQDLVDAHWMELSQGEDGKTGLTLNLLRQLSIMMNTALDREGLLRYACVMIREFFHPDRVVVFGQDQDGQLDPLAMSEPKAMPEKRTSSMAVDLVATCLEKGSAVHSLDLVGVGVDNPEVRPEVRTAFCVPISTDSEIWGALYVDMTMGSEGASETVSVPPAFSNVDYSLITYIGLQLGFALERLGLLQKTLDSEKKYRWIVEHTPHAILTLRTDLTVAFINKNGREIMGLESDSHPPDPLPSWKGLANREPVQRLLESCRDGNSPGVLDLVFEDGAGERVVYFRASPVTGRSGEVTAILCLGYDVTKERQMQDMMQRMERLSALGEIISGVAHELNNPLTAILGFAGLVTKNPAFPKELIPTFDIVTRESRRASRIVKNLLTFSRTKKLEKKGVQINDLVNHVLSLRSYDLRSSGVEVRTDLEDELPTVVVDAHHLIQVFLNLINNAQQAMESQADRKTFRIVSREFDGGVSLEFEDSGPGIPKGIREKIFDPFFTTKPHGKGTGLGLSVSHGIIAEHGGRLLVRSEEGVGTTFTVELPFAEPEDLKEPMKGEPAPETANFKVQSSPALIIDDEESNCIFLKELLDHLHIPSVAMTDANQAVETILSNRPFLVICDIRMPEKSGIDIFEEVQRADPVLAQRFLFATGDALTERIQDFLTTNNALCLRKPFSIDSFKRILKAYYERESVDGSTSQMVWPPAALSETSASQAG